MSTGKKILSVVLSVALVMGIAALSAGSIRARAAVIEPTWWQNLPDWVQWILRYICFGWIWMKDEDVLTTGPGILVSKITISGGASVKIGGSLRLIAAVTPSDAANQSVTWSVNNADIATISASGLLTGKQTGIVIVTATAKDGSRVKDARTVQVNA